ncbi:hypothetical protein HanRHA438_Chr13g0605711 [Helianthus annuus]|nr:hypothetical protein HanRHA438_Chr13g0605711 [Helianthus annuus]
MAKSVWWEIFNWIRVSMPQNMNKLVDILSVLWTASGEKKCKKLVYTVVMASVWRLWKARNLKVYENKFLHIWEVMELTKEDTFVWICNRTKLPTPK